MCALDRRRVCPDATLPSVRFLGHQSRPLQHRDVLLDRGERHVVVRGKPRYGLLSDQGAADDVAAGRIGEGLEDPVHLVIGELLVIYNHVVVRYYLVEPRQGLSKTPLRRRVPEAAGPDGW